MLFECYFGGNFADGKDISGFEILEIQFFKAEIDYCKKFMKSKKNQKLLTNFPSN